MQHGRCSIALFALLVVAACAGARPPAPSAATRAAIERAEAHQAARRHDLARAEYERAIAAAPDVASEVYARTELASTLAFWGELAAAAGELERVVALAPETARAWHDLGILRHHLGDEPGAEAALRRAAALAPREPRPRIALAALLWRRGDRAGARAEYEALLELDLPARVREQVEWAIGELSRSR